MNKLTKCALIGGGVALAMAIIGGLGWGVGSTDLEP